jgi:hypothetical protein
MRKEGRRRKIIKIVPKVTVTLSTLPIRLLMIKKRLVKVIELHLILLNKIKIINKVGVSNRAIGILVPKQRKPDVKRKVALMIVITDAK